MSEENIWLKIHNSAIHIMKIVSVYIYMMVQSAIIFSLFFVLLHLVAMINNTTFEMSDNWLIFIAICISIVQYFKQKYLLSNEWN